jgi:hypothetical protein
MIVAKRGSSFSEIWYVLHKVEITPNFRTTKFRLHISVVISTLLDSWFGYGGQVENEDTAQCTTCMIHALFPLGHMISLENLTLG